MGIYGQDWASYQSAAPSTSGLSFVFVKVTEGLGYVNPLWVAQRDHARANGLVVGYYAYPHIANDPAAEADHFLSQINLQPGDILCLDWEWYGQSVTDQQARDYKDAWLARVKNKAPGHRVGIYADTGNWKNVDQNSNCGDFLWIADYTTAGQPRVSHPWTFHQYSDSPQDEDVANFASLADLKSWAGVTTPAPTPKPAPAPAPTPQEDDMPQWHSGPVTPGTQPVVALVPHGDAWSAYQKRTLHLGMDEIGTPNASAQVRVAVHDGTKWGAVSTVSVTAAGGTVDVDVTGAVKVSLQTTTAGVSYSVESW